MIKKVERQTHERRPERATLGFTAGVTLTPPPPPPPGRRREEEEEEEEEEGVPASICFYFLIQREREQREKDDASRRRFWRAIIIIIIFVFIETGTAKEARREEMDGCDAETTTWTRERNPRRRSRRGFWSGQRRRFRRRRSVTERIGGVTAKTTPPSGTTGRTKEVTDSFTGKVSQGEHECKRRAVE